MSHTAQAPQVVQRAQVHLRHALHLIGVRAVSAIKVEDKRKRLDSLPQAYFDAEFVGMVAHLQDVYAVSQQIDAAYE